ncbi:MAG: hypothetical protein ABFS32_19835, partial [Bacteroidota bacterium]
PDFCGGSETVYWTVTSDCEDDVTCSATFEVEYAPVVVLTCQDETTVPCLTQGQVDAAFSIWLGTTTFTGGCNPVMTNNNTGAPDFCGGSTTVTWTVTSDCEDDVFCTATFTVPLNTPPVLNGVPGDQIVECDGSFEFVHPTVIDDCDPGIVLHYSRDDGRPLHDPYFEPGTVTEICFWAQDECNPEVRECFTVTAELCPYWCTYTQGFYGNPGGLTCWGQSTTSLITELLATELVIGCDDGTPDFTIEVEDFQCVLDLLPGGGPSKALWTSPANGTCGNPNFAVSNKIPQYAKNALVAQAITLSLNLREGAGWGLGNLPMYDGLLRTTAMINCDPNIIPDPYSINPDIWTDYQFDDEIMCQLINDYGDPTVYDLLDLANRALCGEGFSNSFLGMITEAITAINEGFDECRFGYFVEEYDLVCEGDNTTPPSGGNAFMANVYLKASPNPFSDVANIEFAVPMTVRVSLDIYTLQGQLVETLYTGMAEKDVIHYYKFHAEGIHMQSTYVYVLRTIYGTKYGKLIMIK